MIESVAWLVAVAMAVAVAGFVQSAIGFGFAAVALALMSFYVEMHDANLLVSLCALLPLAISVYHYRSHVEWPDLVSALAGAGLAMGPGVFLFRRAPADLLVRITGLVILAIAVDGLVRRLPEPSDRPSGRRRSRFAVGTVSGILSGAVGIGGPPMAAYVVRQPWPAGKMKGFLVGYLFVVAMMKAAALTANGLITWEIVSVAAMLAPLACVSSWLGVIVSNRWPTARFRQIALCLLAVIAIGMVVRGSPLKRRPPHHTVHPVRSSTVQTTF